MSRFFVSDVRVDTVDLLEDWYSETWTWSSELARPPYKLYDRETVERTCGILKAFFPKGYFVHEFGKDNSLPRIGLVKRLLMRPKHLTSFAAIGEVCDLLTYAKERQPKLYRNLRHQCDSEDGRQFQASLYEAFTARQFEKSGLDYVSEAKIEGKPRDGSFSFQGTDWIVECKQQFAPRVDEFDIMRRAVDQVLLQLCRGGVEGGIGFIVRVRRPAEEGAVASVARLFEQVLAHYSDQGTSGLKPHTLGDPLAQIDVLPLKVLDLGDRTSDSEFIARIEVNPENHSIDTTAAAPVSVGLDFFYSKERVQQKLVSVIQTALQQHENRGGHKLLICLDSQELPDLELGLLQGSTILDEKETRQRIEAVIGDAMVLITQRQYVNASVKHRVFMFYNAGDEVLADHLMTKLPNGNRFRTTVLA